MRKDAYGQVLARVRGGGGRPVILVAHTDHPAFEIVAAAGTEATARVLGGFRGPVEGATVLVHSDAPREPAHATVDRFIPTVGQSYGSPGLVRVRADRPLAVGDWAVLDLPALAIDGDELRMAAADDLVGCGIAVRVLHEIVRRRIPADVTAAFTRAEEIGLLGAYGLIEAGGLRRDAVVVSIEASRSLPHAAAGGGAVVRVGDRETTFDDAAEGALREAAERLAARGVVTQRALLDGGTCEATAFTRSGWTATAIAVPNVNYHNRGADRSLVCEAVRLGDVLSAIELLVEAAPGLGAIGRRRRATAISDEVRRLLRRAGP